MSQEATTLSARPTIIHREPMGYETCANDTVAQSISWSATEGRSYQLVVTFQRIYLVRIMVIFTKSW